MQTQIKVEDGYYVIRIPVGECNEDRTVRDFIDFQQATSTAELKKHLFDGLRTRR